MLKEYLRKIKGKTSYKWITPRSEININQTTLLLFQKQCELLKTNYVDVTFLVMDGKSGI